MLSISDTQIALWAGQFFWPFLRILAVFSTAPGFSSVAIPPRAKVALAFVIAVAISGAVKQPAPLELSWATAVLAVEQVLVGLAIGFAMQLTLAAMSLAGEFVGLQMGFSFAGFFDPHGGTQSAVGSWLHTLALLLFVAMNGHLLLVEAISTSFRVLPITGDPLATIALLRPDRLGTEMFRLALSLALPATLLLLFVNLALGFVSRVAPQLSIFSVGFPITLLVGLGSLLLVLPQVQPALMDALQAFLGPLG